MLTSISLLACFQLNEPAGLCAAPDGSCLYVADTNNHAIKILSLSDGALKEVRHNI